MTYRQMKDMINDLHVRHLDDDVTILLMGADEVMPVMDFVTSWGVEGELIDEQIAMGINQVEGVIDWGHPYLTCSY